MGVPVPPGFIVTTEACNAFLSGDEAFPAQMWEQELEQIEAIEKVSGKKFGASDNPLLVSCRSGSKFSMPGMMDTILNIGLNDEVAAGMVADTGDSRESAQQRPVLAMVRASTAMLESLPGRTSAAPAP